MSKIDQPTELSSTCVIFGDDARSRLLDGMNIAARAVGVTLGPKGKCVLIQQQNSMPIVTKDGVSVARSIRLEDPVEAMGADLVKEAASRTNDVAGDGTTTATVLTRSLVSEGLKLMSSGHDRVHLKRGIEHGVKHVIDCLKSQSNPVSSYDDIKHIGTISANGDVEVGKLIATAMERVGRDGIITIEDAKGMSTTMDVVEGMQIDRGYVSPYFVNNNEKMHSLYVDAYVLVTDRKISTLSEMVPLLESIVKTQCGLFIVADDIEGEALQALVVNKSKGALKVVAVRAPGWGKLKEQLLSDIAILTGTQVASAQTGVSLDKMTLADLGRCKKVVVTANSTTLVGTGKTAVDVKKRVNELRSQLTDVTLDEAETAHLKGRIARLSSGVAIIRVGGSTELEMVEKKYRIEDALNATKAAAEEGIVLGGGMALTQASWSLDRALVKNDSKLSEDELAGARLVVRSCLEPIRTIVSNAGGSPDVVIDKLKSQQLMSDIQHFGWNAATGEMCDMLATGVIDPLKVSRTALENAASVATTFLSLDAVVYEEK